MNDPSIKRSHRHLPHWSREGSVYYITFRLKHGVFSAEEQRVVFDHILTGDPQFYQLFAMVVMPDHVHLIAKPNPGIDLSRMTKGIKGVAARMINELRRTSGALWLGESYDRIIRSEEELHEKALYLLDNPRRAGLVELGETYPFVYCRPM